MLTDEGGYTVIELLKKSAALNAGSFISNLELVELQL
jgi:hypothetical protein